MTMVNLSVDWRIAMLSEVDNIEIYSALLAILHHMADDECYTSEHCFRDLHALALEVRKTIGEGKLPEPVLEQQETADN